MGCGEVRDTVETCTPQARATSRMVAGTALLRLRCPSAVDAGHVVWCQLMQTVAPVSTASESLLVDGESRNRLSKRFPDGSNTALTAARPLTVVQRLMVSSLQTFVGREIVAEAAAAVRDRRHGRPRGDVRPRARARPRRRGRAGRARRPEPGPDGRPQPAGSASSAHPPVPTYAADDVRADARQGAGRRGRS